MEQNVTLFILFFSIVPPLMLVGLSYFIDRVIISSLVWLIGLIVGI